jgi:outer membrane PBP1 activator LpoA protein
MQGMAANALCLMACAALAQAPIEERRLEPAKPTPLIRTQTPAAPTAPATQPLATPPAEPPVAESFAIGGATPAPNSGSPAAPSPAAPAPAAAPVSPAPDATVIRSGNVLNIAPSAPKPAAQPAATNSRERRAIVLLPTKAPAFEKAAKSVRAGIVAAAERAGGGVVWKLEFLDTTESPAEIAEAFTQAQVSNADLVIGPLTRAGVNAALDASIARPTVLLNAPDNEQTVLRGPVLAFALSLDAEARRLGQLAFDSAQQNSATAQTRKPRAIVVQSAQPLSRRIAAGFADTFTRAGGTVETVEVNMATVSMLSGRVRSGFDAAFLATDAGTARMSRPFLPRDMAIWGTSQLNTGREVELAELHGVRFADMPWKLAADHPAVMAYPREAPEVDDARLYAFGIDAFRLGVELMNGKTDISLDGVTGRLSARVGQQARVEREAMPAMVRSGQIVNIQ